MAAERICIAWLCKKVLLTAGRNCCATAIMSVVDAVATFKARAAQCGLSEKVINALASRGWDTYAGYAFSSSYVPGQSDDSTFKADV
eukprot:3190400-Amphidinium_carterae.1